MESTLGPSHYIVIYASSYSQDCFLNATVIEDGAKIGKQNPVYYKSPWPLCDAALMLCLRTSARCTFTVAACFG